MDDQTVDKQTRRSMDNCWHLDERTPLPVTPPRRIVGDVPEHAIDNGESLRTMEERHRNWWDFFGDDDGDGVTTTVVYMQIDSHG